MFREIQDARTWAVKHAKEILSRMENFPSEKPIMLEMGYGPSGLPHIGTVAEALRTMMVAKVLQQLTDRPTIVIAFVDDVDGMRKVVPGFPNQEMLKDYIGKPLCNIPDPFGKASSLADYAIQNFIELVESFGYKVVEHIPTKEHKYCVRDLVSHSGKVILLRASNMYRSGSFDEGLSAVLDHHKEILNLVLPTLGEHRQKTYSPFMPISPEDGRILEEWVREYHPDRGTIVVETNSNEYEIKATGEFCKLQWKIDFGMRWAMLEMDYELVGKDISIGSVPIASRVCEILGHTPPITPKYEMFLAADNTRISKTKGNGIALEDMIKYTDPAIIEHFMFLNPFSAKRLDIGKIPSYVDSFIKDLIKFRESNDKDTENPVWYINHADIPVPNLTASITLNLIQSLNLPNLTLFEEFLRKRISNFNKMDLAIVNGMYQYYHDHYSIPEFSELPEELVPYMLEFTDYLSDDPLAMQTKLYDLGNQAVAASIMPDLRMWFQALYKSLLGQAEGPRLGSFFAIYGQENSRNLIRKVCKVD